MSEYISYNFIYERDFFGYLSFVSTSFMLYLFFNVYLTVVVD